MKLGELTRDVARLPFQFSSSAARFAGATALDTVDNSRFIAANAVQNVRAVFADVAAMRSLTDRGESATDQYEASAQRSRHRSRVSGSEEFEAREDDQSGRFQSRIHAEQLVARLVGMS